MDIGIGNYSLGLKVARPKTGAGPVHFDLEFDIEEDRWVLLQWQGETTWRWPFTHRRQVLAYMRDIARVHGADNVIVSRALMRRLNLARRAA